MKRRNFIASTAATIAVPSALAAPAVNMTAENIKNEIKKQVDNWVPMIVDAGLDLPVDAPGDQNTGARAYIVQQVMGL